MDQTIALHQQAIAAALSSNWKEALRINEQILETEPKSVEALNRLARAYFELGEWASSKKNFESALKNDPYNQIAAKFLKRIETCSKKGSKKNGTHGYEDDGCCTQISSDLFIEEPGKTKLVNLLKVAEPQKLSRLSAGTPVNLIVKNRGITITDRFDEYLGVLPDDLSHRLIRLIHGGNKYQALAKTVKVNGLAVLIREIFRSARFKNQPSFLDGINVNLAYSSEHIVMPDEEEEAFESDEGEEESL